MWHALSERLSHTIRQLKGLGRLTTENIQSTLKEIRHSLLDADVSLAVIQDFIEKVKLKALGQKVMRNVRPGDALVQVVQDELTRLLGSEDATLNLKAVPPVVIVCAGLQGSGKTTTVIKLAHFLGRKQSVAVVSTDTYRPAAIEQLSVLAKEAHVTVYDDPEWDNPVGRARAALEQARLQFKDILIVDTAGRLHLDTAMMHELVRIHETVKPQEVLLVLDGMTGQDAAKMGQVFSEHVPLTGIVLTKMDGDARGGAALSVSMMTKKPIKFIGVGEKIDALEVFHPKRMAARILNMGDISTFVEKVKDVIDKEKAEQLRKKLEKNKSFDFEDFLGQLRQLKKIGNMQALMEKIPGFKKNISDSPFMEEKKNEHMEAIILSMTKKERRTPLLLKKLSRKRRLALGSGTSIQEVNQLLKFFTQAQKMLSKNYKSGRLAQQLKGKIPEDFLQ